MMFGRVAEFILLVSFSGDEQYVCSVKLGLARQLVADPTSAGRTEVSRRAFRLAWCFAGLRLDGSAATTVDLGEPEVAPSTAVPPERILIEGGTICLGSLELSFG